MLYRSTFILLSLVLFTHCARPLYPTTAEIDPAPAGLIIDDLRQEFAPDKRVALFQVEAVPVGQQLVLRGETNLPMAHTNLLSRLQEANINFIDSVQILPAAGLGADTYGLVRQSVANIRSEPRHSGELATQALLGTPLRVYKQQDSWFLVQTPDGYLGWLDSGGFAPRSATEMEAWRRSPRVIFTGEYGIVRAAPGDTLAPVGDVVAGDILEKTGQRADHTQVRYPDGRQGYLPTADLADLSSWLTSRPLDSAAIFQTAYRFLGRPYLWGGTSGKGMDCSGFTKTVYFLHGLVIPRDASQQVHAGADVPTDTTLLNLLPGDFLFFGNYRAGGSERVTHVGIYLGDGRFIHSGADNGAVRIQSLRRGEPDFAEHRLKSLLRARRYEVGEAGIRPVREMEWYF